MIVVSNDILCHSDVLCLREQSEDSKAESHSRARNGAPDPSLRSGRQKTPFRRTREQPIQEDKGTTHSRGQGSSFRSFTPPGGFVYGGKECHSERSEESGWMPQGRDPGWCFRSFTPFRMTKAARSG